MTDMNEQFWRFARKRHDIYERRLRGEPAPWTDDPILLTHKFTNTFRAADRVSQYLLRVVQYTPDQFGNQEPWLDNDVFFRTVLFRLFNQPATWQLFRQVLGEPSLANWNFNAYSAMVDRFMAEHKPSEPSIYNAAYIIPASQVYGFADKHRNLFSTLDKMVQDRAWEDMASAKYMRRVYELLTRYPLIGPFLGFQLTIDLNYSTLTNFDEDEYVVAGPGALRGVRKTIGVLRKGSRAEDVIALFTKHQDENLARFGLEPIRLRGPHGERKLHMIDVQNLFCEFDKYSREAFTEESEAAGLGGMHIKQGYTAESAKPLPVPFFPPKWGLGA